MLHRGVEAYGTKSLDAISLDFVNSFRSKNNNAGTMRNWGVVTLPLYSPFYASINVTKNAFVWKESIVIDHRGLLSSDPFTKGLEHTASGGMGRGLPRYLFCARRLSRYYAQSRVPKITPKARRHANTWLLELHSRIGRRHMPFPIVIFRHLRNQESSRFSWWF